MLTKEHMKWNFEILQELIEGPLLNPKRMEEAIKVGRFIRRLVSFFHPFSHRFSDMPAKVCICVVHALEKLKLFQANHRWVRLGCSLLTTLMASPDGLRFLSTEDDFLKQIVKSFAQLDPVSYPVFLDFIILVHCESVQFNGTQDSDPIFSKKRVAETLTYGYFEMLGALSKNREGVECVHFSQ
jgi:rapamycin-insensitive companion of mTOR